MTVDDSPAIAAGAFELGLGTLDFISITTAAVAAD
jgi:hypothetical protein